MIYLKHVKPDWVTLWQNPAIRLHSFTIQDNIENLCIKHMYGCVEAAKVSKFFDIEKELNKNICIKLIYYNWSWNLRKEEWTSLKHHLYFSLLSLNHLMCVLLELQRVQCLYILKKRIEIFYKCVSPCVT